MQFFMPQSSVDWLDSWPSLLKNQRTRALNPTPTESYKSYARSTPGQVPSVRWRSGQAEGRVGRVGECLTKRTQEKNKNIVAYC